MSDSEKPWYWGVDWAVGSDDDSGWSLDYMPEDDEPFSGSTMVEVFEGGKFICALGVPWVGDDTLIDQRAALLAAAPQTAQERDELRAEVERLRADLASAPPAQTPRPYPMAATGDGKYQEAFGADKFSLTIKTQGYGEANGSGWFCISEEDLQWEENDETGKVYRVLHVANDDLIYLRDKLNEVFPPAQQNDASGELERLRTDAARYQRLRILGCAVYDHPNLAAGTVSRFTNLDEIVDDDLARVLSRGEGA